MDYERTLRYSIQRRMGYAVAKLLRKDFSQPQDCYMLKLPDAILAKIFRQLPRHMLSIICETCQRLNRLCYTIGLMPPLSMTERLQYLECFTRNLLDKWVCARCRSIHRYRYSDGPLKQCRSGCPWGLVEGLANALLCFPVAISYHPRFAQFVLKYQRLLKSSNLDIKHSAMYNRIMSPIYLSTRLIDSSDPRQEEGHIWLKPMIENDCFFALRSWDISKVEGFEWEDLMRFMCGRRVCSHQAGTRGCEPRPLDDLFSYTTPVHVISEMDDAKFHKAAPSIPSQVYRAATKGNGDDWTTVAQAAWEEPGKYFEGSCYACPTVFGMIDCSPWITIWTKSYLGSESEAMAWEYLTSYASDYDFAEKESHDDYAFVEKESRGDYDFVEKANHSKRK